MLQYSKSILVEEFYENEDDAHPIPYRHNAVHGEPLQQQDSRMTGAVGKVSPPLMVPSQPPKNSQSNTSRKPSPVGGQNVAYP
ncbi:hypothetical protein ACLOJK_020993 [Asimina triloba]